MAGLKFDPAKPSHWIGAAFLIAFGAMMIYELATDPDIVASTTLKALALGYRGDIDAATRASLQATGTAHLLAISGLHIGMVAALFSGFQYSPTQTLYAEDSVDNAVAILAAIDAYLEARDAPKEEPR